jgi:hypothetical protein
MNKKFFNLLMIVGALFLFTISSCKKDDTTTAPADTFLATTTVQNRVAVLEDFTGVRCGYCPAGHAIAKSLLDANPGKFIVIAVNNGDYAAPAAGYANFTTIFGDALISQAIVTGFPAGTINRMMAKDLGKTPQSAAQPYNNPNGYAMGRADWTAAATTAMAMEAPVNVGAKATYSSTNKTLTVKVDLYFTSEVTGAVNLNVALLQDKLYCKQSGGTPDPNNYEENHVLRHYLTGQWGTEISTTGQAKGTKVSKTYTYVVPADYNGATIPPGGGAVVIDDLSVVAFVANGHTNILNAKQVDVK